MQHSIVQLLTENSEFDELRLRKYFTKLVTKLRSLEQYKYLPPKFSYAFETLLEHCEVELKDISTNDSGQRLIKTSYNKRKNRKSNSRSSSCSGSSVGSSMLGYYKQTKKGKKKMNKTTYSSGSEMSSSSKRKRAHSRDYNTTRKVIKSGPGFRLIHKKKGKGCSFKPIVNRKKSKSNKGSTISSINSSLDHPSNVIGEMSDSDSDELTDKRRRRQRVKTEEKKFRKYNLKNNANNQPNSNLGNPQITMIQTTQNFNTITNNTNMMMESKGFPELKTEKVSDRLLKRKKDTSEIGYLNFPNRSTRKINKMHQDSASQDLTHLKNEMIQKSVGVGGALTQFKKRKQRRLIKQLMEDTANGYGSK